MGSSIKNSPTARHEAVVSQRLVAHPEHPNILNEATPWHLDFRQMGSGDLCTEVVIHGQPDCILSSIRMNCPVHQTGAPPKGFLAFGIPETVGVDKWQARELSGNPLLSFGAVSGFDSYTNSRHVGITLVISEVVFNDFAYSLGFDVPDRASKTSVFDPAVQTNRLIYMKQRLQSLLSLETVFWTESLTDSIAHDVLAIISDEPADFDERSAKNRRFVLGKAIELMELYQEEVIPISILCRDVGTSWRTINRAFLDEFSIGPKAYFNRLRLNRVRSHFLNSRGRTSVVDAANRYDFWHMGQFAKDYRALFGELPSETLRRIKSQPKPGWR